MFLMCVLMTITNLHFFRKLHQTHNDYVLLISEAAEFERDMRTILLPGENGDTNPGLLAATRVEHDQVVRAVACGP